jgi:cytochrome c peroxidase
MKTSRLKTFHRTQQQPRISKNNMRALLPPILMFTNLFAFPGLVDRIPVPPPITPDMLDGMKELPGGLNALPAIPSAIHSNQKSDLGKRLFFDTRLSLDGRTSCATCHNPDKAFTDGLPRSTGFQGAVLRRNAPTILNAAYNQAQFWDGRATSLDEQCKTPLLSPTEMNMIDEHHLIDRLNRIPGYLSDFQSVFAGGPSLDNVASAIAAFEQTLITADSPFDRYMKGDKNALSPSEKRGLILFFSKGACSECHKGVNFTDGEYHNLGDIPGSGAPIDLGRFEVTHQNSDIRAFKTPGLRNVARTAPYMHDGAFATLEEVIEFYDRGGDDTHNKSTLIYKLNLTAGDKSDLLAFLKSLNGSLLQIQNPQQYPDEQR